MKTMKKSRQLTNNIILEANTTPRGGVGDARGLLRILHGWGWVVWGGTGMGLVKGMAWEEQGNDDGDLLTMESLS